MKNVKSIAILLVILIILIMPFEISEDSKPIINYDTNSVENIILFIGDGMGEEHIEAASTYLGQPLSFENMQSKGFMGTYSLSGVTDSAASATAMATGKMVENGVISRYNGQDLETILEVAKKNSKKTGIVTTDYLYGATPAAFSSHTNDRDNQSEIINDQIFSDIDLLMGKGLSAYQDYSNQILEQDYTYVTVNEDLNNVSEDGKVFATFSAIEPQETATETSADLSDLVNFALEFLENENGFVLMIEGANIDKKSHSHDLQGMIYELLALSQAVEVATNWASAREDTCIMVTADHETGGLQVDDSGTFENLLTSYSFSTFGHTGTPVPYYISGYQLNNDYINNRSIYDLFYYFVTKIEPQ